MQAANDKSEQQAQAKQPAGTKHEEGVVTVYENGAGLYAQTVDVRKHRLFADEPETMGGNDSGPSPYDYLLAGLGACTSMTMRMYAERKGWPVKRIEVRLYHEKIHAADCDHCETKEGRLDRIMRIIEVEGDLSPEQRQRLHEIADKCPVHKTLTSEIHIVTRMSD